MNGDWRDDALCAQIDDELFFPDVGKSSAPAKRVCFRCHVRPECLIEALVQKEQHGVRGGLSERDRRSLGPTVTAALGKPTELMAIAEDAITRADKKFANRFQRVSSWVDEDFQEAA